MTTRSQTFGWTQLEQAPPGKYVKFIMTAIEDGAFVLTVRGEDSVCVSITLPEDARRELAIALLKGDKP